MGPCAPPRLRGTAALSAGMSAPRPSRGHRARPRNRAYSMSSSKEDVVFLMLLFTVPLPPTNGGEAEWAQTSPPTGPASENERCPGGGGGGHGQDGVLLCPQGCLSRNQTHTQLLPAWICTRDRHVRTEMRQLYTIHVFETITQ